MEGWPVSHVNQNGKDIKYRVFVSDIWKVRAHYQMCGLQNLIIASFWEGIFVLLTSSGE